MVNDTISRNLPSKCKIPGIIIYCPVAASLVSCLVSRSLPRLSYRRRVSRHLFSLDRRRFSHNVPCHHRISRLSYRCQVYRLFSLSSSRLFGHLESRRISLVLLSRSSCVSMSFHFSVHTLADLHEPRSHLFM